MKILTAEETKDFLTKTDIQKLNDGIVDGTLRAELVNKTAVILFRKQLVPLFVVLELIETL